MQLRNRVTRSDGGLNPLALADPGSAVPSALQEIGSQRIRTVLTEDSTQAPSPPSGR